MWICACRGPSWCWDSSPIALSPYTMNQDLNWTQNSLVSLLWGFPTWPPMLVTTLTGHFMWVLGIQPLVPTREQQVLQPRSCSPAYNFISRQSSCVAQAILNLNILLLQHPKFWDYRPVLCYHEECSSWRSMNYVVLMPRVVIYLLYSHGHASSCVRGRSYHVGWGQSHVYCHRHKTFSAY